MDILDFLYSLDFILGDHKFKNTMPPKKPDGVLQDEDVAAVALAAVGAIQSAQKVPAFYPSDPELWWIAANNALESQSITEDAAKFNNLVAQLPASAALFIRELILSPPNKNKCEALKEALVKAFATPAERKYELLFNIRELGDKRPTEMLCYMKSLADSHLKKSPAFRYLFLRTLPTSVRTLLSTSEEELADLAAAADTHVAVLEQAARTSHPTAGHQAEDLEVNSVRHKDDVCYIHRRYGKNAYQCADPRRCRMRNQTVRRPEPGNDKAGR